MNEGFYLRPARLDDMKDVFELSNEESVRRQSIRQEAIPWDRHQAWFAGKLADPNHVFYIIVSRSGAFRGQLRYAVAQGSAAASVSLHPAARGKGWAAPVLRAGDDKLLSAKPQVSAITAHIRPDNAASVKAFESAGYAADGHEQVDGVGMLRLVLRRDGFAIGGRRVDSYSPAFIVAELSANHNQSFDLAIKTIRAMKEAGANAVKLQTYTPDTITIDAPQEHFRIKQGTLWDGRTLHELYKQAMTPWDWQPKLKEEADRLGLICFSSPFDPTAVDFLERMGVPAYKIASFEITDIPLIEYVASKGKPIMISTGIAGHADIADALAACRKAGNDRIALLKCTSAYPAPVEEANLRTIPDLAEAFGVVPGLSDHTLGNALAVTAVALGAKIVEKHFILDRKLGGPDSAFSLEPGEFKALVDAVRDAEKALGERTYEVTPKARQSRDFSRSLFVVRDVKAGEAFAQDNVRSIRPGFGMKPKLLPAVLGRKASRDIPRGTPLSPDLIAGGLEKP